MNARAPSRQQLVDALAARWMPKAKGIALNLAARYHVVDVDVDELVSEAYLALAKALPTVDLADPKLDLYLTLRVRGGVVDFLRSNSPTSRRDYRFVRELANTRRSLRGLHGREPTPAALAAAMDLTPAALLRRKAQSLPVTLVSGQTPISDRPDAMSVEDTLAAATPPESDEEAAQHLELAIQQLRPREREVLMLQIYDELLARQVGVLMGVSEGRISQINRKARIRLLQRVSEIDPSAPLALVPDAWLGRELRRILRRVPDATSPFCLQMVRGKAATRHPGKRVLLSVHLPAARLALGLSGRPLGQDSSLPPIAGRVHERRHCGWGGQGRCGGIYRCTHCARRVGWCKGSTDDKGRCPECESAGKRPLLWRLDFERQGRRLVLDHCGGPA